jgi:hypothetical protein
MPKPEVWMGEVPDNPIDAMDNLRGGEVLAVTGAGCEATVVAVPAVLLLRPNSAVKVFWVKEARRSRGWPGLLDELLLSSDIL